MLIFQIRQKHMHLELKPGKLLNTLLWAHNRNPNYLGELLIYSSFVILSADVWALLFLVFFVCYLWIPNMAAKDKSLSRYPEFAAYKSNSCKIIPAVW